MFRPAAVRQTGAGGRSSSFSPGSYTLTVKFLKPLYWHVADGFWFRRPAAGTTLVRFYPL